MFEDLAQTAAITAIYLLAIFVLGRLVRVYANSRHGAWLRRFGIWIGESRRERYARRLAARVERGEDRYFEELRSILASNPDRVIHTTPRERYWTLAIAVVSLFLGFLSQVR